MILLKGGLIFKDDGFVTSDILIDGENIIDISPIILVGGDCEVIDCSNKWVRQGAVDVHVHLREPGYCHKETIYTGTMSAAKGGVTTVFAMPNLNPVPDSKENLQIELDIIKETAVVNVLPYLSLTKGQKGKELSEMIVNSTDAIAYSDDGKGVSDMFLLEKAMEIAKKQEAVICSHAEAEEISDVRAQEYAAVRREAAIAQHTKCKYHFCHLSTFESFEAVRKSKSSGADISCEVTPHHLTLCSDDIADTSYKMNPPLRSKADMNATIEAIKDGTATIIATDHAPHAEEEKAVDYAHAPNGIIGLETFLPIVYTSLVKTNIISPKKMIELTTTNAQARFGLPICSLNVGERADICVLDINNKRKYTKEEILSKSSNSPFIGKELYGFNILTLVSGKIVYRA
ncbi:dihydroorotase [bacterium]|nr:dihydroorotase [bacterium]